MGAIEMARIERGRVVERLSSAIRPEFHPDFVWLDCPREVEPGWIFDGSAFSKPQVGDQDSGFRRRAIDGELYAIDAASARPLRAIVLGSAVPADHDRLAELEAQAEALRQELANLA